MHVATVAAVVEEHMADVLGYTYSGMKPKGHCRMLASSFCVHHADAQTDPSLHLVLDSHIPALLEQSCWQILDACELVVEVVVRLDSRKGRMLLQAAGMVAASHTHISDLCGHVYMGHRFVETT